MQISLLTSSMVELVEQRSQEIPSQTMINPKEIASDIELEDESENPKQPEDEKELEMDLFLEDNEASIPKESTSAPKVMFEVSIFTDVSFDKLIKYTFYAFLPLVFVIFFIFMLFTYIMFLNFKYNKENEVKRCQ